MKFFAIATGYTFGWWALITIHIGTLLGAMLGFVSSRYWLHSLVEQKVASLPSHWSARVVITWCVTGSVDDETATGAT